MYSSLFDIGGFINWVRVGKVDDGHYTFGHVFQAGVQNIKQCDCWTRFRRWFYRKKQWKNYMLLVFFIKKRQGKIGHTHWWSKINMIDIPLLGGDSERLPLSPTISLTGDFMVGKEVGGDTVMGDLTEGKGGGEAMRSASCWKERLKQFIILQIANMAIKPNWL